MRCLNLLKFVTLTKEIVNIKEFTRFDSCVIVNYKGKEYKRDFKVFGTKLFPANVISKNYLRNTLKINVNIPEYIQHNDNTIRNNIKTVNSSKGPSFFVSPNGTCLSKMDWDFD